MPGVRSFWELHIQFGCVAKFRRRNTFERLLTDICMYHSHSIQCSERGQVEYHVDPVVLQFAHQEVSIQIQND